MMNAEAIKEAEREDLEQEVRRLQERVVRWEELMKLLRKHTEFHRAKIVYYDDQGQPLAKTDHIRDMSLTSEFATLRAEMTQMLANSDCYLDYSAISVQRQLLAKIEDILNSNEEGLAGEFQAVGQALVTIGQAMEGLSVDAQKALLMTVKAIDWEVPLANKNGTATWKS